MVYPKTLVLVRHGQSEANLIQKGTQPAPEGFHDRPDMYMRLSAEGVKQAQTAGEWLKNEGYQFGRFYTSPYLRTIETANHLNISDKWLLDDLWRERDWGEYGRYSRENQEKLYQLSSRLKQEVPWYWKPPGGESLSTGVRLRVNSVLTHLSRIEPVDSVIAVTHGEFISTTRFVIEKMNPHQWLEYDTNPDYTIRNANIIEYTRVNPWNPDDIKEFYTWKRVTNPWDKKLSHDNGEWVQLEDKQYTIKEMMQLVNTHPNLLS